MCRLAEPSGDDAALRWAEQSEVGVRIEARFAVASVALLVRSHHVGTNGARGEGRGQGAERRGWQALARGRSRLVASTTSKCPTLHWSTNVRDGALDRASTLPISVPLSCDAARDGVDPSRPSRSLFVLVPLSCAIR